MILVKPRASIRSVLALLLLPAVAPSLFAQPEETTQTIGRTTERELSLVLSSSFGSVVIGRGDPGKILLLDAPFAGEEDPRMHVNYTIRNRVGYADVTLGEPDPEREGRRRGFKVKHFGSGTWHLRLTDAVPISFDIELGVGRGNFDLSGLKVRDFTLSSGASEVTLTFNEPNETVIDNITIESGVSRFVGQNLGNANFKRFKFQGGLGAYTLDFHGNLRHEVDVEIEVGLGTVTIIVPREVGAKVLYEKSFLSRFDYDRDFTAVSDDQYITENYGRADGRMNIRIDSGLGSVKIQRR